MNYLLIIPTEIFIEIYKYVDDNDLIKFVCNPLDEKYVPEVKKIIMKRIAKLKKLKVDKMITHNFMCYKLYKKDRCPQYLSYGEELTKYLNNNCVGKTDNQIIAELKNLKNPLIDHKKIHYGEIPLCNDYEAYKEDRKCFRKNIGNLENEVDEITEKIDLLNYYITKRRKIKHKHEYYHKGEINIYSIKEWNKMNNI